MFRDVKTILQLPRATPIHKAHYGITHILDIMRYSGFATALACLLGEVHGFSSSTSSRTICELK